MLLIIVYANNIIPGVFLHKLKLLARSKPPTFKVECKLKIPVSESGRLVDAGIPRLKGVGFDPSG